jgi:hypothetical protein
MDRSKAISKGPQLSDGWTFSAFAAGSGASCVSAEHFRKQALRSKFGGCTIPSSLRQTFAPARYENFFYTGTKNSFTLKSMSCSTGAPDLSALEAAQANAVKPDATGYMSTGYVTRSLFMDSTCSQPDYTYGTKVNVCLLGSSYGYMFRLVQGELDCDA